MGVRGVFLCRAPELNRYLKSSFPRGFIYSLLEIDVAVAVLSLTILTRVGTDSDTCSGELGFRLVWGMEARGVPQVFSLSEKEGLRLQLIMHHHSLRFEPSPISYSSLLIFQRSSQWQPSEVVLSVVSWPPLGLSCPSRSVCASQPPSLPLRAGLSTAVADRWGFVLYLEVAC